MTKYYYNGGEFTKNEPLPEENDDERTFYEEPDLTPSELQNVFEAWLNEPYTSSIEAEMDDNESIMYWYECLVLVDTWVKYNASAKLLKNAENPATRHKVWHVVEHTFGGNIERLKDREKTLLRVFQTELDYFNSVCEGDFVSPVNRSWLRETLNCSEKYRSIRRAIFSKLRKREKPMSLRELA